LAASLQNRLRSKIQPLRAGDFRAASVTQKRPILDHAKFRHLLLRFERLSALHYAFKSLAYAMINLRHFC